MSFDPLLLSRIQFGFVVSFHILFPAFTIGIASWLAFLEWRWLRTRETVWRDLYVFWLKIFAVSFGMGVVSGIVMSFQFGTNWSVFSEKAGNIIGPLLSYEVLTAFFLEATFLGVMLFGMKRVSEKMHFLATCMVALGTLISTFWIISANSWMQTPAGYEIIDGVFHPADWWAVIFNPSFPYRLTHMVMAAFLTTCFVIGGVSAAYLLRGQHRDAATRMLKLSVVFGAIVVPLQILAGDMHGLNTLEHQPAKVMAMEGHYESHPDGAPLILFGIPNSAEKRIDYAVEVPKASSLILKHDLNAPLAGLDTIPDDREPPVPVIFWSFRVMVGIGFAMLGLGLWSLVARMRKRLYDWSWLHRAAVLMGPSGFVAVTAGWITTEVGRQPYTVYGHMLTAQSASPLAAPAVAASLIAFVIVYFAVFGAGAWYILHLMHKPAGPHESEPEHMPVRTAGITPAPAIATGAE